MSREKSFHVLRTTVALVIAMFAAFAVIFMVAKYP